MATSALYADEPSVGNIVVGTNHLLVESAMDGLTATGSTQAGALQLFNETNRFTTVAAGTGAILPPAVPGLTVFIIHHGANNLQVYGNGTDVIDDQTNTVGVTQMFNSTVLYTCTVAGKWYTEGLGTGFSTSLGLQTLSYAVVAANTTVTQAAGTAIKASVNHVTSSAAGAVTLPVSTPGLQITVALATAGNAVTVFPNAGGTTTETINALAANAGYAMTALTSTTLICAVAGQWFTVPRVTS